MNHVQIRAALDRFFVRYSVAFNAENESQDKAYLALEGVVCYLAGFTLVRQGLTPEQAGELAHRITAFESLWGDTGDQSKPTKERAVESLERDTHLVFVRPFLPR